MTTATKTISDYAAKAHIKRVRMLADQWPQLRKEFAEYDLDLTEGDKAWREAGRLENLKAGLGMDYVAVHACEMDIQEQERKLFDVLNSLGHEFSQLCDGMYPELRDKKKAADEAVLQAMAEAAEQMRISFACARKMREIHDTHDMLQGALPTNLPKKDFRSAKPWTKGDVAKILQNTESEYLDEYQTKLLYQAKAVGWPHKNDVVYSNKSKGVVGWWKK